MTLLFKLFDFFLPPSLRNNSTDLMRGYILIGLIFSNVLTSLFVAFSLIYILKLEHNTPIALGLNLTCVVGYVVTLIVLRRTENYMLCANILLVSLAIVIAGAIQITGGYLHSPVLQLTLQLPVTAFLLLGLRAGIAWVVITLAICTACYASATLGVGYVQLMTDQSVVDAMYILLQFVLMVMLGGGLVIYELMNSLLTKRLNEERSKFEHKASHDDLTGIPNRFEFFRRIKSVIGEAREREQKVAIVYLDLDGFKPVNDLLGHHIGDEALQAVARRLQNVLRLSDTTARLGGDEFALILPGIHVPTDIQIIMPKILAAIREPIKVDRLDVVVHASCGVAIFPDHSTDHSELCRYADKAMYLAKEQHNTYLIYDDEMNTNRKPEQTTSNI